MWRTRSFSGSPGLRAYFEDAGVPIVPLLFASYEEQTEFGDAAP